MSERKIGGRARGSEPYAAETQAKIEARVLDTCHALMAVGLYPTIDRIVDRMGLGLGHSKDRVCRVRKVLVTRGALVLPDYPGRARGPKTVADIHAEARALDLTGSGAKPATTRPKTEAHTPRDDIPLSDADHHAFEAARRDREVRQAIDAYEAAWKRIKKIPRRPGDAAHATLRTTEQTTLE